MMLRIVLLILSSSTTWAQKLERSFMFFFIEVKFKKLDMQSCSILSNYFRVEVIKTVKYFELKPGNHHQPFSPLPRKLSKVLKKKILSLVGSYLRMLQCYSILAKQ